MRRRLSLHPLALDAGIAALLLGLGLYEGATTHANGSELLRVVSIALVTAPLALRRRHTLTVAFVSMSGLVLEASTVSAMNSLAELLAGLLVAYTIPRELPVERALIGIPLLIGGIGAHRLATPHSGAADLLFDLTFASAAWAAGYTGRRREQTTIELEQRTERLEDERERAARDAAAGERLRIAGELHDIVAHALGVVAVQAGAAEKVLAADPDTARAQLSEIRVTVREAVVEMRRLLGVLRGGDDDRLSPQPSLAQLDELLTRIRKTGLTVGLVVEGTARPLAPGVELSAFRIVQEALTNVVRHADASRADVAVRYGDETVVVEVTDDGTGDGDDTAGHGLIGVRERVALHGGRLDAGPRPDGGFCLHAVLPLRSGLA